jgi:hypothetical protein
MLELELSPEDDEIAINAILASIRQDINNAREIRLGVATCNHLGANLQTGMFGCPN